MGNGGFLLGLVKRKAERRGRKVTPTDMRSSQQPKEVWLKGLLPDRGENRNRIAKFPRREKIGGEQKKT